jgi:hypothetical protein
MNFSDDRLLSKLYVKHYINNDDRKQCEARNVQSERSVLPSVTLDSDLTNLIGLSS